ncbi:DNA repair nuclease APEX1-like [Halichondria panicea]|uniref:DNA repair nuclease APEX1-like n=1 Tax=Halichondria panicea TaxID=6063 RepID=UPI00312BCA43
MYLLVDLKNPKTNTKTAGFTPEERQDFTELLEESFVDTFRHLYPDLAGAYTYQFNARAKNTGWRLDYFVVSERLLPHVTDVVIRKEVFGSDRCPLVIGLTDHTHKRRTNPELIGYH